MRDYACVMKIAEKLTSKMDIPREKYPLLTFLCWELYAGSYCPLSRDAHTIAPRSLDCPVPVGCVSSVDVDDGLASNHVRLYNPRYISKVGKTYTLGDCFKESRKVMAITTEEIDAPRPSADI